MALRCVVARTAATLTAGPLRGFIDHIETPCLIEGWAQDIDHPELPVLLEALLDDCVIGTALACRHRPDLVLAGIGQGRCGFRMTTTEPTHPAALGRLRIRRAADLIELPVTLECRQQIDADLWDALPSWPRKVA